MNTYFKKYAVYLILRNELPFDKINPQDLPEVERLLNIYYDIFSYITDKYSKYHLKINNGFITPSILSENRKISKNELYEELRRIFNYSMDDINAVLYIDDNWNINCVNCTDCYKCINCVECKNCSKCEICFRCKDCKSTINRRDEENLINDNSQFPLIVGQTFTPNDSTLEDELRN